MTLLEKIKQMCEISDVSINKVEQNLGLGRGTIARWDINMPSADKLRKIADYFDVSTDYLLGRTDSTEILAAHRQDDSEDLTPEQQAELEQFKQFIIERDKNKK